MAGAELNDFAFQRLEKTIGDRAHGFVFMFTAYICLLTYGRAEAAKTFDETRFLVGANSDTMVPGCLVVKAC